MKRIAYILLSVAAITACTKEQNTHIDSAEGELTFTAATDAPLTRTTMNAAGEGAWDIAWAISDQIRITDGTSNAVYKPTTAATRSPLSKYSGTAPTGPVFYAYYPSGYYNVNTGVFSLPELIGSYTSGTFTGFPMYAQSENADLAFKNVCGLLALSLSGEGDDKIGRVNLSANEYLSGPMTIVPDGDAWKAEITSGSKEVAVSFLNYRKLSEGAIIYLPLPEGTYTNFTINVLSSKQGVSYAHKVATKDIVIVRSQVTPITLSTIAFDTKTLNGTGTAEDPFLIENEADLLALAADCRGGILYTGQYIKIVNDITLTAAHKPFALECAELDGNGKTITVAAGFDFSDVTSDSPNGGFISKLKGTVKDLTIDGPDVTITAEESVNVRRFGAVVGFDGTVRNCCNKVNISFTSSWKEDNPALAKGIAVGGVMGYGSVYDSVNEGNISLTLTNSVNPASYVGGISGMGTTVSGCSNIGNVLGDGVRFTGGITGGNNNSSLPVTADRCINSGAVTGIYKYSNANYCQGAAGGIVGAAPKGTITNCGNSGQVIGQHNTTGYSGPIIYAAGIVGISALSSSAIGTVQNCYNTADIIARTEYDNVGFKPFAAGISGRGGNITNCYTGGTIYTKAKGNDGLYDNKSYGGAIIGYLWYNSSSSIPYEGGAGLCWFPQQNLGGSGASMRTIGYVSKDAKETSSATTTTRGSDTGGKKFDRTTLLSVGTSTIGETEYPAGTDLVTLLNAGVATLDGTFCTWTAGTGTPAYPVFE